MKRSLAIHPLFEELTISLVKLDALLKIASSANLLELEAETIFNYLWATEDIIEKAKNACKKLANEVVFF